MPKLKSSATEICDKHFRAVIERERAFKGMNDSGLAQILGVSTCTLYKRKRCPATITICELRRLANKTNITPKDLCEIVGIKWQEA